MPKPTRPVVLVSDASPQWMPMRTRTWVPAGQNVSGKSALHFDGAAGTGTGGRKDGEKAVSLGAYLLSAVGGEGGPDHFVVLGQSVGISLVA